MFGRCFEIMLRKRTRSLQKDQQQMGHLGISEADSDHYSQFHALGRNIKSNPVFNVPRLLVGLGPIGLLDSDSIRSPKSPLEFRVLSHLGGNPVKAPRSSPNEGYQRSWDCCKVGLSIIDSLEDCSKFSGKVLRSSESKNTSVSPKMRTTTPNYQTCSDSFEASKSLPKNFGNPSYTQQRSKFFKDESNVLFEIGETYLENEPSGKSRCRSLDSCSPFSNLSGLSLSTTDFDSSGNFTGKDLNAKLSSSPHFIGGSQNGNTFLPREVNSNPVSLCSSDELIGSLTASDIELSEDYTCVKSHGPNPKTTHMFGDLVLNVHFNDLRNNGNNKEKRTQVCHSQVVPKLRTLSQYPSSDFLSFCYHCNKKLEDGKDIYMYRLVSFCVD